MYDKLLSEDQLNKVKDTFNETVDFALEEAIKKHVRPLLCINFSNSIISKQPKSHGGYG
jgi:hypothetical protein